jgi:hypothetical protein
MIFQAEYRPQLAPFSRNLEYGSHPAVAKLVKHNHRERAVSLLSCNDQGGALVEMAIALPVMLLIVTAIVSFGMLLSGYQTISHAVDVGARNLALSRGESTNPCADAVTVIQHSAPTFTTTDLTYTFKIGSDTFSGSSTGFSGSSSTDCSVLGVSDMVAGETASVSVSYPFQLMIYGWSAKTMNVTAIASEVIQ